MNEIQQLISAHLDGTISDADSAKLFRWVNADPKHARIFARETFLHSQLRQHFVGLPVAKPSPKRGRFPWVEVAAAAVVVFVLGGVLLGVAPYASSNALERRDMARDEVYARHVAESGLQRATNLVDSETAEAKPMPPPPMKAEGEGTGPSNDYRLGRDGLDVTGGTDFMVTFSNGSGVVTADLGTETVVDDDFNTEGMRFTVNRPTGLTVIDEDRSSPEEFTPLPPADPAKKASKPRKRPAITVPKPKRTPKAVEPEPDPMPGGGKYKHDLAPPADDDDDDAGDDDEEAGDGEAEGRNGKDTWKSPKHMHRPDPDSVDSDSRRRDRSTSEREKETKRDEKALNDHDGKVDASARWRDVDGNGVFDSIEDKTKLPDKPQFGAVYEDSGIVTETVTRGARLQMRLEEDKGKESAERLGKQNKTLRMQRNEFRGELEEELPEEAPLTKEDTWRDEVVRRKEAEVEASDEYTKGREALQKGDHKTAATYFIQSQVKWKQASRSKDYHREKIAAIDRILGEVYQGWGDELMADGKLDGTVAMYKKAAEKDPARKNEIVAKLEKLQHHEGGQAAAEPEDILPPAPRTPPPPVNPYVLTENDRLSTFALEADTAAYTLTRRFISKGYRPYPGVVRMEEFVNAFDYHYPQQSEKTFTIHAQAAPAPFGKQTTLVKIGVKGKVLGRDGRKPAHLVYVIDASGSMGRQDRMPLVKHALSLLVGQLGPKDRVTLVTYGTKTRLHLEAVSARDKNRILQTINAVECGSSTNMQAGIELGYQMAARHYKAGEINRVILCSDGVANVGPSDAEELLRQVDGFRRQGITFTSVGVGAGSYDDQMLEQLANKGDGNYVYIDTPAEAHRVFVENMSATLQTIAKDVKIQVEFDPRRVRRYRLIGYENRAVADKDFRNDKVDAGEIGSGQSATALYEVELLPTDAGAPRDLGTVYVRYKNLDTNAVEEIQTRLQSSIIRNRTPQDDPHFFLAACAAEFAEILRGSEHAAGGELQAVEQLMIRTANTLPLDKQVKGLLHLVQRAQGLPQAR